jgi:hypothetical protein
MQEFRIEGPDIRLEARWSALLRSPVILLIPAAV